jgi:hypothetical protein
MLVNLFHRNTRDRVYLSTTVFIAVPLVLSAFMHLWNPVGFPAIHVDEGHYMRRAMQVLEGLGPQESISVYMFAYDHPYFGQIFLASVLNVLGYPDVLQPKVGDIHSIEMLYLIPRILMGVLAVIDTFLVYKIAETRYNRKVAFIAATLFAVLPLSWLTRGVYLDSILLPFLLSSIYFAVSTKQAEHIGNSWEKRNKYLILLSGIFLGLAIFTKTPVLIMIPLVAVTILKNNKNAKSAVMMWFVPVILIPMIWPVYAISQGQFDEWVEGVFYQVSRETGKPLRYSLDVITEIDPVLLLLAAVGFIYSELKRDYFIFLWIVPYSIFLFLIGWVVHFHWIMLLPAFCIVAAVFIEDISKRIKSKKVSQLSTAVAVSGIGAIGLVSTSILITTNLNSSYFELYSFTTSEMANSIKENSSEQLTLIATHRARALVWIPQYVFGIDNVVFRDTDVDITDPQSGMWIDPFTKPIETKKIIFILDSHLRNRLVPSSDSYYVSDKDRRIGFYYYNADTIATFVNQRSDDYPVMTIEENYGFGRSAEVRANYR